MNTIHSVSNTSRMRSSEAVAVRNSFSFRSLVMRVMLVMGMMVGLVGVIDAQTQTLTFSLTSNPGGWPTANSTTLTNYTYRLNGTNYTFALKNVKQNSGYLMLTTTAVLGLPAIDGYKLTKVVASNSSGCSTSTRVGVSSSSSSASYITGGAYQTWSTTSSSYTYNLSGTAANTMYYLYVTNKNAQITKLVLTYTSVAPSYTITAQSNNNSYGTVSLSGTTITATPATCCRIADPPYTITSGSATVSQSGNTFNVTPSSNCTVRINFEPVPTYTVTFNAGTGSCGVESRTEQSCNAGIVLPEATVSDECSHAYTFYGWSTAEIEDDTEIPSTIVGVGGETYHPTGNNPNVTLYAVYVNYNGDYVKVTSGITNWSGKYLIVYEVGSKAFNGNLAALDNYNNFIDVTISNNEIVSNRTTDASSFTISGSGSNYIIKSNSGYYIGQTSDANGLLTSTVTQYTNAISYYGAGSSIDIHSSGGAYLRYNSASNQNRFRYYKSSTFTEQKAIQLYRKSGIYNTSPECPTATVTYDANRATGGSVPIDNTAHPVGLEVTVLGNINSLVRTGYSFDNWNTEPDGSGDGYSGGDSFIIEEDIILYAQWAPDPHTILFNTNGVIDNANSPYYYDDFITDQSLPTYDDVDKYCEGKHFVGWSESKIEDPTDDWPSMMANGQIARTIVLGDMIYYAVYANIDENIAPYNTTLWSETWDLGSTDDTPSVYYADGHNGTIIYDGTLTYAQSSGDTRLQAGINYSGGTSPELLMPNNETWTISNIPTGGAYKMSLTFKSNRIGDDDFALTIPTPNVTISGTGLNRIITAAENVTSFDLTIRNESGNNARIDDVELKIIQIYGTGYTTFCPCNYDIDNISDGDLVWAGKNTGAVWNSADNWVVYNEGEGYRPAANAPTAPGNNAFLLYNEECFINTSSTLNSDITCNNLTITGNIGINLGEHNLTVKGNITNNGNAISGNGKIIFAGISEQTISGTTTTFNNVEFNNSNGITASTEPTINGTATFTNGIINGNVTFGSGATVSDASANSYVNGKVTKNGMNGAFTFPTGTASLYAPFEASSSTASNVSVQYAAGSEGMPDWWNHSGNLYDAGLNHASDRENWQISASATTTLSDIKLYWNAAADNYHSFEEDASALNSYLNVAVVKKGGFYWQNLGKASIDGSFSGAGSITAAEPLTITVGAKAAGDGEYFATFASSNSNVVLPIELISFTATCNGRSSIIEWITASEKNNDYFVLERSHDAVNFKEIARIAGAGNSIEPISYAYTDYGARSGDNYYRLVQVDYDGTSTASEIIVANCLGTYGEPEVLAYPNPFGDDLTLRFENFGNTPATIEVYDMLGRMVHTQKVNCSQNDYEVVLRLAGLSDGTYNVRISTADFVINRKVVKE